MCSKTLVVQIAVAVMGASSAAMARGDGKGGSAPGCFFVRNHNARALAASKDSVVDA